MGMYFPINIKNTRDVLIHSEYLSKLISKYSKDKKNL